MVLWYQNGSWKVGQTPMRCAQKFGTKGCLSECRRKLQQVLHKQQETLMKNPVTYPLDLSASHTTREHAMGIQEILKVCGTALSSMPYNSDDELYVDSILGNIIQPLLQSCRLGCQSLQQGEMAIFLLNNISVIQLEISEAAKRAKSNFSDSSWSQLLEDESKTWVDVLVNEEVSRTLRRSDLDKLLELIEVIPESLRAVDQVGLNQDRIDTIMRSFYASIFSTLAPQFDKLHDPGVRELIRHGVAVRISDAHIKIHNFVSLPSNGYNKSVLTNTIEEVKVLLGC